MKVKKQSYMDSTPISVEFPMEHKDLRLEPLKLLVADDVKKWLVKGGYWNFLSLYDGFDLELTNQMVNGWNAGNVKVFGYNFTIDTSLLAEITGLPEEGDNIRREKYPLISEMGKFFTGNEKPLLEKNAVLRDSLPKPWPRVAGTIMNYFTLNVEMKWVRGYHFAFLSNLRWGRKINVPDFLFYELDRAVEQVRKGKMKIALHQGLFLLIFKFMVQKKGWMPKVQEIPSKKTRNEDPPKDTEKNSMNKEEEEVGLNLSAQKKVVLKRSFAALENLLVSSERFEKLRAQAMEEARIQFKDVKARFEEFMDEE